MQGKLAVSKVIEKLDDKLVSKLYEGFPLMYGCPCKTGSCSLYHQMFSQIFGELDDMVFFRYEFILKQLMGYIFYGNLSNM